MKLVRVECSFDGSKILFFFTADGRVDFRELVQATWPACSAPASSCVRSACATRPRCSAAWASAAVPSAAPSFMDDFVPVSIKMAKTQNLSLNPTKISGTCGRLMCCLKYEQDGL